MTVEIVELPKPKKRKVQMICDVLIDPKLEKYPMIKDCFSKNAFTIILGRPGQGKTSITVSLLDGCFRKCFEQIITVIPSASRLSLKKDIFSEIDENDVYDDLSAEVLEEIFYKCEATAKDKENTLIIIDDFQHTFKNADISKALQRIVVKHRHLRTSIMLLQQTFFALPKNLRELVGNIISYNLGKSQMEKLFNEVVQIKRDTFDDIMEKCFVEPHDFIVFNLKSRKLYCNWNLVKYED